MDLINGEIDIDTNLKIEKFSDYHTVYAIGSCIQEREEEPILLIKNDGLKEDILVLKYIPDEDGDENELENTPVDTASLKL